VEYTALTKSIKHITFSYYLAGILLSVLFRIGYRHT